jgi:error-prone DNA polymerase
MGFYQPAQLVIDARNHGVDVRPVDVNHSQWDNTLEELSGKYHALRLGFRQVGGMREDDAHRLVAARGDGYRTMQQLRDAGLTDAALEKLADADAFRSMNYDRRTALWHVSTKDYQPNAIFSDQQISDQADSHVNLPKMRESEQVIQDYASSSLTLRDHPVKFVRYELDQLGVTTAAGLKDMKNGDRVKVSGLVLVRQRPGTAKGVCFMTIEDETGVANLVVWPDKFNRFRKEIIQSRLFKATGTVQRKDNVIHVVVESCENVSRLLGSLTAIEGAELNVKHSRADETSSPFLDKKPPEVGIQGNIFHGGRNFH